MLEQVTAAREIQAVLSEEELDAVNYDIDSDSWYTLCLQIYSTDIANQQGQAEMVQPGNIDFQIWPPTSDPHDTQNRSNP